MPAISEELHNPESKPSREGADLSKFFSSLTTKDEDKWKITQFQTTPPMSTYIVAWANGDFKYLEKSVVMPLSGKTIPLRIYGEPLVPQCRIILTLKAIGTADIIHQAQFALDVKAAVLPLYEKVFDVEYPLPKLDTLVVSLSPPGRFYLNCFQGSRL